VLLGLGAPRAMLAVAVLATLLAGTSVGSQRALDDWVVALIAEGRGSELGLVRAVGDCFRFTDGSPALTHRLIDAGNMLPWWSDPALKIAFFRPLSAFTHVLDQRLWPSSAVAMHLQNLAWFLLLLGSVALVYRRLGGSPALAGLAFALYALDDAHALTIAWISNRNALIAGALGCFSLYFHDRWRREGHRTRLLASLTFLLSWSAGEFAIGAFAYLVSYALFVDPASRRQRLMSVLPYAVITVVWRSAWSLAGYGVTGSGGYVDPFRSPQDFVRDAPIKWLSLLQGQFGLIPSDAVFLGDSAFRSLFVLSALAVVVTVSILLARHVKDSLGRFWACGLLFSLLPLAAAFPNDRLLLLVGLGAMPLLARLFRAFFVATAGQGLGFLRRFELRQLAVAGLLAVHCVWAPLSLPGRAAQLELFATTEQRALDGWLTSPGIADKTVLILSAPSVLFANYAQARQALLGLPRPAHLHVLSATDSELRVERDSTQSLTLTPQRGFLGTDLERHYRADERLAVGAEARLTTFGARVVSSMPDGRPQAVRFQLSQPLSEYLFLCWSGDRFSRCELPQVGQAVVLAKDDFGAVMARAAWSSWFDAPEAGGVSVTAARKP
jgi:GNAT superfamily N-acetyltransferase